MDNSLLIIGILLIILIYFTSFIPYRNRERTVYVRDADPIHSRFFVPYWRSHPIYHPHRRHLRRRFRRHYY
jgi:hypothetical protein